MNPDELLLFEWLIKNSSSRRLMAADAIASIKNGSSVGYAWLGALRRRSLDGADGATSALNAAERLFGKAKR